MAASHVPEIPALRCTETIAEAPAAATDSYALVNASGAGREVDTERPSRSAAATAPGVIDPWSGRKDSGRLLPSTITWSGTTTSPASFAADGTKDDVESVTTATPDMAQP